MEKDNEGRYSVMRDVLCPRLNGVWSLAVWRNCLCGSVIAMIPHGCGLFFQSESVDWVFKSYIKLLRLGNDILSANPIVCCLGSGCFFLCLSCILKIENGILLENLFLLTSQMKNIEMQSLCLRLLFALFYSYY